MPAPGSLLGVEVRHLGIPVLCGLALVAIIGIGAVERTPSLERHLERDIEESVLVDLPKVRAEATGRDIALVGEVDSRAERELLRSMVRRRWGVRVVDVKRLRIASTQRVARTLDATFTTLPSTTLPVTTLPSTTLPVTTLPSTTLPSTTVPPTTAPPSIAVPTTVASTLFAASPTTLPESFPGAIDLLGPAAVAVPASPAAPAAETARVEMGIADILRGAPLVFARSAPTLGPVSDPALDRLATLLKANAMVTVQIQSFTDDRGQPANNLALSQRRANAVRSALIARGVAPIQLTAAGFGEARPVADNTTESGRTRNRRIELVVAG